ncbi:MAG: Antirestriction protein KlcA [Legionella sp.]|uniref:antirestriction protein n=1 Tax=Legionella sp. TaxID=459 RepID=UPI003D0A0D97
MNNKIVAIQVKENKRIDFLPGHIGNHFLRFENAVYYFTKKFCLEYNGGSWDFLNLSNGGFYIKPNSDERFSLFVESNHYEGTVTSDALGIITSLFSLNQIVFHDNSEILIDKYYFLRDFALEHKERESILSAID